jgi:inhibitor of KinA
MTASYKIFSLGDQAVSLEFNVDVIDLSTHQHLMAMKARIEQNRFSGFLDIVLGYRSVTLIFDLVQLIQSENLTNGFAFVRDRLELAHHQSLQQSFNASSRKINVPVCYDGKFGFDLDAVCERNHISQEELVRLHTSNTYHVYLIGFLPGFPYMGFVDPQLEVPRHQSPRQNVPAGSVGVAGKQTGIYPFDSPGGWQIIGRTPLALFNPSDSPPVIFQSGDEVSFYSISEHEFDRIKMSGL